MLRDPFSGMTPERYARTPDRVILDVYLAERDSDGVLITEGGRELRSEERRQEKRLAQEERALLPPDQLGIPRGVRRTRVYRLQPSWVQMFWQTWLARGATQQEIEERFYRTTRQQPDDGGGEGNGKKKRRHRGRWQRPSH